jgi:hypothetical protein
MFGDLLLGTGSHAAGNQYNGGTAAGRSEVAGTTQRSDWNDCISLISAVLVTRGPPRAESVQKSRVGAR